MPDEVSGQTGISVAELTGGGRRRELVWIRQAVCHGEVRRLGLSATVVGRMLQISTVSVPKGLEKGERVLEELDLPVLSR